MIHQLKTLLENRTVKYDDHKIYVDNEIIIDYRIKPQNKYTVKEVLHTLEEKFNPKPRVAAHLAFMPPAPSSGIEASTIKTPENFPEGPRGG